MINILLTQEQVDYLQHKLAVADLDLLDDPTDEARMIGDVELALDTAQNSYDGAMAEIRKAFTPKDQDEIEQDEEKSDQNDHDEIEQEESYNKESYNKEQRVGMGSKIYRRDSIMV